MGFKVKQIDRHRLNMLCIWPILWGILLVGRAILPDLQPYLHLFGILSAVMVVYEMKMRQVIAPIVTTSDRFEVTRRLLKEQDIDVGAFYLDGAVLSLFSAVVHFGLIAIQTNEAVLHCFALALGAVASFKFGYDVFLAYLVLRIEWGPSKASKPKSTRPANGYEDAHGQE